MKKNPIHKQTPARTHSSVASLFFLLALPLLSLRCLPIHIYMHIDHWHTDVYANIYDCCTRTPMYAFDVRRDHMVVFNTNYRWASVCLSNKFDNEIVGK